MHAQLYVYFTLIDTAVIVTVQSLKRFCSSQTPYCVDASLGQFSRKRFMLK